MGAEESVAQFGSVSILEMFVKKKPVGPGEAFFMSMRRTLAKCAGVAAPEPVTKLAKGTVTTVGEEMPPTLKLASEYEVALE